MLDASVLLPSFARWMKMLVLYYNYGGVQWEQKDVPNRNSMRSSWNADRADFLITSGVWNMTSIQELFITGSVVFKYYSGEEPEFIEGDVFRIIVPLDEEYSYDNTRDGSIDEIKREVEERLEKEQRRFGEKSDWN